MRQKASNENSGTSGEALVPFALRLRSAPSIAAQAASAFIAGKIASW